MHDAERTQAEDEARDELRALAQLPPGTSVAPRDTSTKTWMSRGNANSATTMKPFENSLLLMALEVLYNKQYPYVYPGEPPRGYSSTLCSASGVASRARSSTWKLQERLTRP